jgi:hypothetical protein
MRQTRAGKAGYRYTDAAGSNGTAAGSSSSASTSTNHRQAASLSAPSNVVRYRRGPRSQALPNAFGVFIHPRFAETIGAANCYGKSISALTHTFGGLNAAAIALGFPTVQALQTAVDAYCGG